MITGEHQILFIQTRIGLRGKPFKIFKFATMKKNSDKLPGGDITVRGDMRVTRFGRILRISKINEFPQLFNVLFGVMSFAGPRPLMEVHYLQYEKEVRNKIYSSKPGITGVGSIILRDEEKYLSESNNKQKLMKEVIIPFKGELELWYISNKSLFVDLMLIFLTFWVIIIPNSKLIYRIFHDLPIMKLY